MIRRIAIAGLLTLLSPFAARAELSVRPAEVVLDCPEASQQLLISMPAPEGGGRMVDVTRLAKFEFAGATGAAVASIDNLGMLRPLAEGETQLIVRHASQEARVKVTVKGLVSPPPVSFENDVQPILTKAKCNSGGCHGKAEGKNGFKLSVFGYDDQSDYSALVKEGRGRRVRVAQPENSLLLLKGTAAAPHGGGQKLEPGGLGYRRLLRWIREGAPFQIEEAAPIVAIEIYPAEQVLLAKEMQQLQVTAIDAAGRRHCVTAETEFDSNAGEIAAVDRQGLIQATEVPGEAAILARYLGHIATCRITLPRPGVKVVRPAEFNFIDKLVWDKLERLGIQPSELADDATFLRRAYFDTIGTLPTPKEAREFLASAAPDKRAALVNALLQRDEYADYWTMKWADILRADKNMITTEGTVAITRWLRQQFQQNRPYDEMVREILTAQGNIQSEGPAAFYKALGEPGVMSRSVSQLFLGVRIECAQCHHHPSERWTQGDYAALAGFFTGVKQKKLPTGADAILSQAGTDLPHPRTGELVPAAALGAAPAEFAGQGDRRVALARWMTANDNPFFARAIANRLWAHYFGRGLVEQIDDMRATNPASNEPLLDALAAHLREVKYDLKAFTRTLLASRVYQLASDTNESNADDFQNFSHAQFKALPAEVLLDAICQATGKGEKFNGWPEGYRAVQIWDNRMPSYFFTIFGRPVRASVCECERSNEPSIAQALHLMNSPEITEKIRYRHGAARKLADSDKVPNEIIDELSLGTLSRYPSEQERSLLMAAFNENAGNRRAAAEDVLWALLNAKEFLYNH